LQRIVRSRDGSDIKKLSKNYKNEIKNSEKDRIENELIQQIRKDDS
jgi:hypothetical protein